MDPNAALDEIRRRLYRLRHANPALSAVAEREELLAIAELIEGLDDWLRHGGFLPFGWRVPFTE